MPTDGASCSEIVIQGLSPYLLCEDSAAAIAFYEKAFGAREMMRLPRPDGGVAHACVAIGDAHVMLADEEPGCTMKGPKGLGGTPVILHLSTNDVDALFARAVAAGAKVIFPVTDMFWGDRYGVLEDPAGHQWSLATTQREVSVEEMTRAMEEMAKGTSGPEA